MNNIISHRSFLQAVSNHGPTPRHAVSGQRFMRGMAIVTLALTAAAGSAQTFTILKNIGPDPNDPGLSPQSTLVQGPDGTLYGTTYFGPASASGTVYKVQPDGGGFTVLKSFTGGDGANPIAGLALSDNVLYGTAINGGSSNLGVVFRVNTDGTGFSVLRNFAGYPNDGANPYGGLTISNGVLYGTTEQGGTVNGGTVFSMNTNGTGFTVLRNFTGYFFGYPGDATVPTGSLTLSGGVLYGTTEDGGGTNNFGTVFRMNTNGTGYTLLKRFTNSVYGAKPFGGLTLSDGVLYGTTGQGGTANDGTVFSMNTDGTGFTVLKSFTGPDGDEPYEVTLVLSGGVLYGTTIGGGASSFYGTVFSMNTNGSGYTLLHSFSQPDGASPQAGLTLSDGILYGTTSGGSGLAGHGTVFKLSTNGTGFVVLDYFNPIGPVYPEGSLTLSGSVLYGTTSSGGTFTNGTVFSVNTDGTGYTNLHNFTGSDGMNPHGGLALGGGVLYGTTLQGAISNFGTVYRVNTDGTGFAVLRYFTGGDGAQSYAGLTLSNGVLYGTASTGTLGGGTVFALNTDGTGFTNLVSLSRANGQGWGPTAGLTLCDGVLYGTTSEGGLSDDGAVFRVNTDGTGFAELKDFTGSDGLDPDAALTLSDGVLYGTTTQGGASGDGTIFAINTDGTGFRVLKDFTIGDGRISESQLALVGNVLYGSAVLGGNTNDGTLFAINTDGTGFNVLRNFAGFPGDGANPVAGMTLSGTVLYGATESGGSYNEGTLFKLDLLPPIPLNIQPAGGSVVLTWTNAAFALQSAPDPAGVYTNVPGATSPYTNSINGTPMFFRLMGSLGN